MVKKADKRSLFKINYIADLLGITPRTIRYYDQMQLLPHIKRSAGGIRLFDQEDIDILQEIRRLQKEEFLPLEVIRDKLFGSEQASDKSKKAIVCDGSIFLSDEIKKAYSIFVIPNFIEYCGQSFLDGAHAISDFKERYFKTLELPKIEVPSEADFVRLYLSLADQGYEVIYSVHISSLLLPTYSHAVSAADQVKNRIQVIPINSKSCGPGHRSLVIELAKAVAAQHPYEYLQLLITKSISVNSTFIYSNHFQDFFIRFIQQDQAKAQVSLWSRLFQINPLIHVSGVSGEFELREWYQDAQQALNSLQKNILEAVTIRGNYIKHIFVEYQYLYGEALSLVNAIKQVYPNADIQLQESSSLFAALFGFETISISIS